MRTYLGKWLGVSVVLFAGAYSVCAQQIGSASFVPLAGTPHDVVYDDRRGLAYVSNRTLNRIDVVNPGTLSVVGSLPVGAAGPTGMSISPDGKTLLVTLADANAMSVIDLQKSSLSKTFFLPVVAGHLPGRVDYTSAGDVIWRNVTTANPSGTMYSLNVNTEVSTKLIPSKTYLRYSMSHDRSKMLVMTGGGGAQEAQVWDFSGSSVEPFWEPVGFSPGNGGWMTQGIVSNDGDARLIVKTASENRLYDENHFLQSLGGPGSAWGTMGAWEKLALVVQVQGEVGSDKLHLLDLNTMSVLDTLALSERIGVNFDDYDYSAEPIDLTANGQTFLAVGQTGLFVVDASSIPEPLSLVMFLGLGSVMAMRRRVC